MTKVRNFAEITPNLPFSEFNFYDLYRETFEKSELGRMKKILPLQQMAESLGLVNKSMMPKRGRKSYFTPEGKVALMFLKMKTQMSFPKLMEDEKEILHRLSAFEASKMHHPSQSIQVVLVTTMGLARGEHAGVVHRVVTLEELFK